LPAKWNLAALGWRWYGESETPSATFRVEGRLGSCKMFTLNLGQSALYQDAQPATISFLGTFDGRIRFDVRDFPEVYESDLRIELGQSLQPHGTDLTIAVVDISRELFLGSSEASQRSPASVSYTLKRLDQSAGPFKGGEGEAEQWDGFRVQVHEILPTQARFAVSRVAKLNDYLTGSDCK
jgi:hypothetical protein